MTCPKCGTSFDGETCPKCEVSTEKTYTCESCGHPLNIGCAVCPHCGHQVPEYFYGNATKFSKVKAVEFWRVFSGIFSILFSLPVFTEAVWYLNAERSGIESFLNILVSIMLLVGGVISIVLKKGGKSVDMMLMVAFGTGSLLCLLLIFMATLAEVDFFAWWCLVCFVVSMVSCLKAKF